MNPDAPSDRPNTNAQPPEPPAARQAAYPSDLAALVLTRWHEATAAGQIDLPPPATSALVDVLSICYKATLLREEGRPVTFRLALSEPDAFAPAAGPPSGLHRLVFARPLPFDEHELRRLAPVVVPRRRTKGSIAGRTRGATPRGWLISWNRLDRSDRRAACRAEPSRVRGCRENSGSTDDESAFTLLPIVLPRCKP